MRKFFVRLSAALFPKRVVGIAYQALVNPQVKKLRAHELEVLEQAERDWLDFAGFRIRTYRWVGGPREVMLVHGWEGQAGNFSDLVRRLLEAGFTVLAFDGPSHGFSSSGPTNLFGFTDLVGHLIRLWEVQTLVSHSFGGVATTYALSRMPEWKIEKYLLFTTPDKFMERISDVVEQTGVGEKVGRLLVERMRKETGKDVEMLNVSEFVQQISVQQALILHDLQDKVIPIERTRNVHRNWPESRMEEVEGTGHFRILRTPEVLDRAVDFLQKEPEQGDFSRHQNPR